MHHFNTLCSFGDNIDLFLQHAYKIYNKQTEHVKVFFRALHYQIMCDKRDGLDLSIYNNININHTLKFFNKQSTVINIPRYYMHDIFICCVNVETLKLDIIDFFDEIKITISIREIFEYKQFSRFDIPQIREYLIYKNILTSRDLLMVELIARKLH